MISPLTHWKSLPVKAKTGLIIGGVFGLILTSAALNELGAVSSRHGTIPAPTVTVTARPSPAPTRTVTAPLSRACVDYAAALNSQTVLFTEFSAAYGQYEELTDELNSMLLSGDVVGANEVKQQIAEMDANAATALQGIIEGNQNIPAKKLACKEAN